MTRLPLEGIRVADFGWLIAGPASLETREILPDYWGKPTICSLPASGGCG